MKQHAQIAHHAPAARVLVVRVLLLAAVTGSAWAQNNFQLPRECSERHNVDPAKCVIQDGAPPPPWLHPIPLNDKSRPSTGGTPTGTTPPAPVTGQMPARKAR